jgi:large subunit ribosomal protein L40
MSTLLCSCVIWIGDMGQAIQVLIAVRMYQSMHNACEELRNFDPPGKKDSGRLYRIAMEKKGIFGHGGVPIEYARAQTETPAKEAWNHGWTR